MSTLIKAQPNVCTPIGAVVSESWGCELVWIPPELSFVCGFRNALVGGFPCWMRPTAPRSIKLLFSATFMVFVIQATCRACQMLAVNPHP